MIDESQFADFGVMEFFLLALVGRAGLSSIYELQQKAALQPGGMRPALRRLEGLNLVTRGSSTVRRKRELAITEDGEEVLRSWRRCLHDTNDTDAALRVICIALLMNEVVEALNFVSRQVGNRQSLATLRSEESENLRRYGDPLSTYRWMRLLIDAHRRGAESETFALVGQFLEELYNNNGSTRQ